MIFSAKFCFTFFSEQRYLERKTLILYYVTKASFFYAIEPKYKKKERKKIILTQVLQKLQ